VAQGVAAVAVDEQLLAAAKAGDQESFARLIEPYIAPGYRLAASMLGDTGLAEDVVQESTLRAWRAIGHLMTSSRVRPWFLTIVANRARTLRQRRWWSVVMLPLSASDAVRAKQGPDDHADLLQALRGLHADERAAIYLRFYEEMNSHEIGDALGISASAVRSRIHRALRRLRVELTEEDL
jgi:RNA polymerase sigma factor (sigma-70 family)